MSSPVTPSPAALKSYLDPKVDLAFKRVFGEHAHVLKSFLNALLPLPDDGQIESLEYLTPEQAPEVPGLFKHSIVDVKCTDQQGRIFIVEMQMMWTASFEARMVFGASQAYVKQLGKGRDYRELRPVYALALIDEIYRKDTPEYYHHYKIVNVGETPESAHTLKGLEFVFIELPKFKPESRVQKRVQTLWLRFLNEVGSQERQVIDASLTEESSIAEAVRLVETGAYTEAQLAAYHKALDVARIETSALGDARAEGEAVGEARGNLAARVNVATALRADGLSVERVAALTGLSVEQVRAL